MNPLELDIPVCRDCKYSRRTVYKNGTLFRCLNPIFGNQMTGRLFSPGATLREVLQAAHLNKDLAEMETRGIICYEPRYKPRTRAKLEIDYFTHPQPANSSRHLIWG